MKKLALVFLLACGAPPTPAPAAPRAAATHTPEAPVTDESRARTLIATLAKHDFAAVEATFDDKMRAALPRAKLEAVWSALEAQAGAFVRVESVDVKKTEDVRVALAKSTFEKAPLLLRVVFDASDRVAGFFVSPGDSAQNWQPPSYANLDAFEEKRVAVGSSPALPGLLALPKGAKKVPAVVLVHGSGPNDEDETIGALKPFKDLAWGLASRGIAVLRYDKRTRVSPSGVRTQKEEVEDAAHAAVALLRAQPEIDPARIALLGHSQGGYLAPRIAKDDPAIARVVVLAGPTRPLEDSLVAQLRYMATLHPDDAKVKELIAQAERFKTTIESPKLKADDEVTPPLSSAITGAYFLDVRGYHPERVAAQLKVPVLVLQGDRDYQVTVADDLPAWKTALAHKKNATVRVLTGLNHAFARGEGPPSPADYEKPAHVDEAVITDIAAFVSAP